MLETSIKEIKSVVTEKTENEKREKTKVKALSRIIAEKIFDAPIKFNDFLMERYKSSKIQFETTVTEIKAVVLMEHDSEFQDETLSWNFWIFIFLML